MYPIEALARLREERIDYEGEMERALTQYETEQVITRELEAPLMPPRHPEPRWMRWRVEPPEQFRDVPERAAIVNLNLNEVAVQTEQPNDIAVGLEIQGPRDARQARGVQSSEISRDKATQGTPQTEADLYYLKNLIRESPEKPIASDGFEELERLNQAEPQATGVFRPRNHLGVSPWKIANSLTKFKVYHKSKKQNQQVNCEPTDEDKNPLFIREDKTIPLNLTCFEKLCAPYKTDDFKTDQDLVWHLRLEAAFQPRTSSLLLSLKNKAIRWFQRYDSSKYTMQERYEMIMRAVVQAMLPETEMDKIMWLMETKHATEAIQKLNHFLKRPTWGAIGNGMPLASATLITV